MTDGIDIETQGQSRRIAHLVLDFTGTLSLDGKLLPGVAERLIKLAERVEILVLTADTFGTAESALVGLPVEVRIVQTGRDKAEVVAALGPEHVAAIGNGRNDVEMFRLAGLCLAVIGPEGCSGELISAAHVVVRDVNDGLDLLSNPLRLKATLRE